MTSTKQRPLHSKNNHPRPSAAIFAEDERPIAEWVEIRICLASIAVACFYPMSRLAKKWEREGKIKL